MNANLRKLTTAGAIGLAGVTGVAFAVVPAVAAPAGQEVTGAAATTTETATDTATDTEDRPFVEQRQERIAEALEGLVEDGTIDQDQADAVAEELAGSGVLGPRHRGGGMGLGGPGVGLDAAAEALGLTTDELFDALRDGDSLTDIAEAQGVEVDTLVASLVAAAEERITAAVEDGRLTQEQADELISGLEERIAEHVEDGIPAGIGRGTRGGPAGSGSAEDAGYGFGRGMHRGGAGYDA